MRFVRRSGRVVKTRRIALAMVSLCCVGYAVGAPAQEPPAPELDGVEVVVRSTLNEARAAVAAAPSNSQEWGEYGVLLHAHRFLDEAEVAYRRAVELDESDFRWTYYLAACLEYKDPAAARRWFERSVELDPGYAPARIRLAENFETLGDSDAAYEQYVEARRLDSQSPLAALGMGRIELERGDASRALSSLERAYELAPNVRAVLASLARARHLTGDRDGARSLALAAREHPRSLPHKDPRRAEIQTRAVDSASFLRRSRSRMTAGDLRGALEPLGELLRRDPNQAEAHFLAASIHDRLGNAAAALASAKKSVELAPDLDGARAVLAGALFKTGDLAAAERESSRVLQEEPNNVHMLLVRSMLAGSRGDVETLIGALDRAYSVGTNDSSLRRLMIGILGDLADSFSAVGDRRSALTRTRQAMELLDAEGAPASVRRPFEERLRRDGG